jgi:hypothetical protein
MMGSQLGPLRVIPVNPFKPVFKALMTIGVKRGLGYALLKTALRCRIQVHVRVEVTQSERMAHTFGGFS